MHMIGKYGGMFFLALLLIHCWAIYLGWNDFRFVTKLLLAPSLIVYLWLSGAAVSVFTYLAFTCCFIGDLLLAQPDDYFFLLGMVAFMLVHIFNGLYFYRLQRAYHSRMREPMTMGVLLMLLSAVILAILNPYLGQMRVPIVVYLALISMMAILAACAAGTPEFRRIAYWYFVPGAISFVLSNCLLALNKFLLHRAGLELLVMLTYGFALYLLASGARRAGPLAPLTGQRN